MSKAALTFVDTDIIGRVSAVDTSKVIIDVEDPSLVSRAGIGNLIAIRGATETEFLIGLTERITRTVREQFLDDDDADDDEMQLGPVAEDLLRVMLVGTYRTVHGDRTDVFKRGADSFPQIDRQCYLIEGGNLQRFMGLLGSDFTEDERLQLGHFVIDPAATAIASGDKFFQRHASILGSTGSGKSWTVALILERASRLKHPNLIVFDMHGEYGPLSEPPNGYAERFRIAGPGDLDKPADDVIFLPYWLLNREEMLALCVEHTDREAENQTACFTTHVRALKAATLDAEKQKVVKDTFTVDSPIPYELSKLIDLLKEDDVRMVPGANNREKQGEYFGKLTRLVNRMKSKVDDRRYGFLFQPPKQALQYNWLTTLVGKLLRSDKDTAGIKIVDFSEVPSDVLPIVTGTFARLLYDVQFWIDSANRTPFTLVCDEAHLYLPVRADANAVEKQALATFERIAKEGRKYGVSLLVVSQRPSDVSRTILSQCNNFLVLRLTNDSDQSVVKSLMPDSMAGLTEIMPLLDTGEALMLGDAVLLPTRIRLDRPTIEPASGTRNFWREWGSIEPNSDAIAAAVETLRRQTRAGG